jgi:Flp pilus assembly protein TadD
MASNPMHSTRRSALRPALWLGLVLALTACQAKQQLHIPPPLPVPDAGQLTGTSADDGKLARIAAVTSQSGDYQAAVPLYKRLAADKPANLDFQLGYANALVGIGDLKGALPVFKTASALAPHDSRPYIGLCRAELALHRPADALADADKALANGAQRPNVYNARGIALDMVGRHSDAQAAYQLGLKQAPDDVDIKNNYALSLAVSGNYEQSVDILTRLVQEPGSTPRTRQNLALALGLEGNVAAAKMIASRDLSPNDVENNLRYYQLVRSGSAFTAK